MSTDIALSPAAAPIIPDVAKIETKSQLGHALVKLVQARERWTVGSYAASNQELYALLGTTLDLLYRIKRSTEVARGLNELLKSYGFTFTDATSTEVKLLRAVFADPAKPDQYKQRIYVYARVLSVAYAADVTGEKLPTFIEQHGGIDEIRRTDPASVSKADKEKLAVHTAEQALTTPFTNAIATGFPITPELQPADGQHFSIALVRKEVDGTGSIVFGTNNASLVRSVLGIAGRKLEADENAERDRRRAAEQKAARESDLSAFTAEVEASKQPDCAPATSAQCTSVTDEVTA